MREESLDVIPMPQGYLHFDTLTSALDTLGWRKIVAFFVCCTYS